MLVTAPAQTEEAQLLESDAALGHCYPASVIRTY